MSFSEATGPRIEGDGLNAVLSQITDLDKRIASLSDEVDSLKKERLHLEKLAIEDMTAQRLDGVKVAGRSWRIEWTHSMSVPEARKEAVMEAARNAGLLDAVTQVNTAKLKTLLKEMAKEAGKAANASHSDGTVFEGLVGEFIAPVLRHLTVG